MSEGLIITGFRTERPRLSLQGEEADDRHRYRSLHILKWKDGKFVAHTRERQVWIKMRFPDEILLAGTTKNVQALQATYILRNWPMLS